MSGFDWEMQQSDFFKDKDGFDKAMWKFIFDLGHRWWMGALLFFYPLIIYSLPTFTIGGINYGGWTLINTTTYSVFVKWFGWGLAFGDLKNLKNLIRRYPALIPIVERAFPDWDYTPDWEDPEPAPDP